MVEVQRRYAQNKGENALQDCLRAKPGSAHISYIRQRVYWFQNFATPKKGTIEKPNKISWLFLVKNS